RARNPEVPIIFISAKSEEIDRVLGLELGADDYIVKPFGVKEVVARVRAVTRRFLRSSDTSQDQPFEIGDLQVYPNELRARRDSRQIDLSLREVSILSLFAKNRGTVLDRDNILNSCWGLN